MNPPAGKLVVDQYEMVHSCQHPLWRGSIPHRLIEAGGMSLQELDDEIARGEALERLSQRLPEVMTPLQQDYLEALRRDRIQLVARGRL